MKSNILQYFAIFLFFFSQLPNFSCDAVCAENELLRELREDIADNGFFKTKPPDKNFLILFRQIGLFERNNQQSPRY